MRAGRALGLIENVVDVKHDKEDAEEDIDAVVVLIEEVTEEGGAYETACREDD